MVNILFDYLRQKAEAVGFVSKAYAQAVRVTRRDGDNNTVSFPAVFENGELKQLSFDAYDSLVFFMLDGEIERKTEPGEISSEEDQITETYKAKAYFFHSGKEISDCASFAQQATYSLAKYICADNDQLETELNLQSVSIIAGSLQFLKEEIWNELHSGIELKLSEKHQLCSIAFEIEISGVESCFVNDPCELGEFSWEFSTLSSCDVIDNCLGIDRVNGSEALVLSEKGTMVPMSGGASTLGELTNVNDDVDSATDGTYIWRFILNEFRLEAFDPATKTDKVDFEAHTGNTSNPHNVTKAQVGLSNVDNTSDANKPVSTAQAAADAAVLAAAGVYADGLVVGLLDDRGNFDASGNAFPSSGGSGTAGAIIKGDLWTISVAGTLGGHAVTAGDVVRALVDTPGQTDSNWAISENNFGYVAENSANKDASGGYVGLTLSKINFRNVANTITSFFTNSNTVQRTYTFPDKNLTVLGIDDIIESIGVTVDGQGAVLATGSMGFRVVPFAGTISRWHVVGNTTGSVQFDIKRGGSSIIGGSGNKPLLSSAQRNNAAPSSWTSVIIAENDELEFYLDSASTVSRVNLILKITRT